MDCKTIKSISPRNLKLIPQSTIKCAFVPEDDRRNAIWDMFVTKSGRCFFSLCAELYVCESAGLYEYIYETNEIKCCFELKNIVCNAPDAIMPSKIHTSMAELSDGRIIMTTHTTSQSPVHPYWHPEPFYAHTFEGYQGSNILIYNPNTGIVENRGIPVPHESIYGAAYDPKRNALYFTGYIRGHLYRYDLDSGKVTDYGKVTEFGSFRLFKSEIDGNIYSASRSGYFYRINTDTQEFEELGLFFPKDYEPYSTGKHVQLDYIVDGKDGNIYFHYIFGYNFYKYIIAENRFECIGSGRPADLADDLAHPNQTFGLTTDENGVFWYTVSNCAGKYDWASNYLVRWDYLSGGEPRNMGLLGKDGRTTSVMAEMEYHDGILYATCGNHHFDLPAMFGVDIKKLESIEYDLNEENELTPYSRDLLNYLHTDDPKKFYPYSDEEYKKRFKDVDRYTDYIDEFNKFMGENPFEIKGKKITAYPFWREYGRKNSPVYNVYYENGVLCAEFGGEEKYKFAGGSVERIEEFKKTEIISVPKEKVPYASGRNFKAIPTASVKIWEDKYLVGTRDGMLFVWNGEKSFNLGACPNTTGEVRALCYSQKTETAYGVVGSYNDISILFSFDKENGVKYLGRAHFNIESGLHLNCELSSVAVNEDGTRIAIGSNEEMGTMYEIEL